MFEPEGVFYGMNWDSVMLDRLFSEAIRARESWDSCQGPLSEEYRLEYEYVKSINDLLDYGRIVIKESSDGRE